MGRGAGGVKDERRKGNRVEEEKRVGMGREKRIRGVKRRRGRKERREVE